MRTAVIFLAVVSFAVSAFAQTLAPTAPLYTRETLVELERLRTASLASDYAYKQTAFLSNNIGPRLSGSKQADRAVEYVTDEMRKLGTAVQLQKLMVPHWERGLETAELIAFPGMAQSTVQKIVLTALGGSVATPERGLTADIVVVESYEQLNLLGRAGVQGKIVLFNTEFDRAMADSGFGIQAYGQAVQFRANGASAAARLGAIASLVRSAGGSQNRLAHTGGLRYADDAPRIPAAAVSKEDAELIAHLVKSGTVRMKLVLTPRTLPDKESFNVIADLKGSEKPSEIVIVSGHLDSWDLGTGALDDAVGVAVSMQVLKVTKDLGLKPKRTIRFIAYMNEENGLVGGTRYAEEERTNIQNHFAAIESDLGASNTVGILFAGKSEVIPFLEPLSSILSKNGSGLIQQQAGVGADIGPLTQLGVPSFAPWFDTRTYFNYHHTAADTFDKVDPKLLAKCGSLMAVLAYGLANLEQPLPR